MESDDDIHDRINTEDNLMSPSDRKSDLKLAKKRSNIRKARSKDTNLSRDSESIDEQDEVKELF